MRPYGVAGQPQHILQSQRNTAGWLPFRLVVDRLRSQNTLDAAPNPFAPNPLYLLQTNPRLGQHILEQRGMRLHIIMLLGRAHWYHTPLHVHVASHIKPKPFARLRHCLATTPARRPRCLSRLGLAIWIQANEHSSHVAPRTCAIGITVRS